MASEKFTRELRVAADAERSWAVLTDVGLLAQWVGILEDVTELEQLAKYTAVLRDKVGPFKLRADLSITANVVRDGERIEIEAAGRDRSVDSRIAVSAVLELAAGNEGGTVIAVDGAYQVTGRVAGMGGGVIRKKADRILADFFGNAEKELS